MTAPNNLQAARPRLGHIDALRGIAATMVLLCHSLAIDSTLKLPNAVFNILEAGKYGDSYSLLLVL
jgi:peptidoglycan/LPS O-acetylase OafA/YrhL